MLVCALVLYASALLRTEEGQHRSELSHAVNQEWAPALPRAAQALRAPPVRCCSDGEEDEILIVSCKKCKAAFPVKAKVFGPKGRRVRCDNNGCGQEWFQSTSRLSPVPNGFELVEYPEEMAARLRAGEDAVPEDKFRCFVGNLPWAATEEDLRELFAQHAGITSLNLVTDEQGRRKGFGFVGLDSVEGGQAAVEALNGVDFLGRELAVSEAKIQARR
jgi:predicted Zn finger-like uncharacterized protein